MLGMSMAIWQNSPTPLPIIRTNLVAWYRKGGASGASWVDSSGNGRTMTLNGSPTIGASSVTFNGTSQWGDAASALAPLTHTVYIRVKPIAWTADAYVVSGTSGRASIAMKAASPQIAYTDTVGSVQALINCGLGAFQNVCGTFDNATGNVTLNVNGSTASGTLANASSLATLTIAAKKGGLSGWANIEVVEVILYSAIHNSTQQAQMLTYLGTL